jgi:hypothetical protein
MELLTRRAIVRITRPENPFPLTDNHPDEYSKQPTDRRLNGRSTTIKNIESSCMPDQRLPDKDRSYDYSAATLRRSATFFRFAKNTAVSPKMKATINAIAA